MADAQPETTILALNSGSSSLKFGLYRVAAQRIEALVTGEAESLGGLGGEFHARDAGGTPLAGSGEAVADQGAVLVRIAHLLADGAFPAPVAIGHRIVHGGPKLRRHCLIDPSVLRALEAAIPFAPLHIPPVLSVIRLAQAQFPGLPQAACFDTQFHADLPDVARVLPIAKALQSEGVQRYGFHGLSCESIVDQLARDLPRRLVIAHLGNGASVTAVKAGASVDTSMGLTPTGGVMMGTRSGDIDPGVLLYLMREKHLNAARLEELLDRRSGLLGVSNLSSDMRELQGAAPSTPDAQLAITMFAYRVQKEIAAMIGALGGVDALVFTGGMGENDAPLRAAICTGLDCMGVNLDPIRNAETASPIGSHSSPCQVQVLPSREDEQIARHTSVLTGASTF